MPIRKNSKKRQVILEALAATTAHPTAQELYQQLKPDYPDRDGAMQSVSAAIENVLLAAWAKGIGSCWLCAPQRMGFGPAFQRRFAPDKGEFVAAVTLGYPDQQPKMPPRRDGRYLIV